VRNGQFSYDKRLILQNIDFSLESREVMAVIGPNGVGKTTLLKCIMNLLSWEKGIATLNGRKISDIPDKQLWRQIAYVPQAKQAVGATVREMIILGRSAYIRLFGQPGKTDYAIADEIIERLHLTSIAERPCNKLSGGELQLVLIARALVTRPQLIIIDEPESNLDYHNQLQVLELISEISQTIGCLINTHYPEHALRFTQKTLLLFKGGEYIYGDTKAVITEDNLQRAFGVESHIGQISINGENHPFIIPLHAKT
jgi:iron complex transport system ATP-binding protein